MGRTVRELNLAPLVDAIAAAGTAWDELADRAEVPPAVVRLVLAGDNRVPLNALWQLADEVRVDPDRAAGAGWPERLVFWLRCARVGADGLEWIRLDDELTPGYYLVATGDDQARCIIRHDWYGFSHVWRPGQPDLYEWRPIRGVAPVESTNNDGVVRRGSPHRWQTDDEVWVQPKATELRRIRGAEADEIRRAANPRAGQPIVAIDIDGVIRPITPPWLVGEPPLHPVPPLPEGVAPDSTLGAWYERDAWRARFVDRHGRRALAELDRLRTFTITVDWRDWPVTRLHNPWVRSFGTRNPDEAAPDAVAFVQDAARNDWSYVPEHLAVEPIEPEGSHYQRWWAPQTAVMEVLLVPWVGRWVRLLQQRGVEVVWSTTWGEPAANSWFGAPLDMPALKWGQADVHPRMSEETISWKIRSLRRYIDRPIAMLDDQPWRREGRTALDLRTGDRRGGVAVPSLLVRVDESRGLTRADTRRVERWLHAIGWTN